jgi:hypothetical protein
MNMPEHTWASRAALVVAAAVLAAIGSAGTARGQFGSGIPGVGASMSDTHHQAGTTSRPDDRVGIRGIRASLATGNPRQAGRAMRPDDRPGRRGIGSTGAAVRPAPAASASGFDWGDAAVGASGAVGVLVAATAAAALTLRRRHTPSQPIGSIATTDS